MTIECIDFSINILFKWLLITRAHLVLLIAIFKYIMINLNNLFSLNNKSIVSTDLEKKWSSVGIVESVADGIIKLTGLKSVRFGEQIYFYVGHKMIPGLVLNLAEDTVSAVIFENTYLIQPGVYATRSNDLLSIPTSSKLLGRVIDPLGRFLDVKDNDINQIINANSRYVEKRAPSIITRSPVRKPLETGIKVIDSLVPIGHGQRELIIGDSKTGKTSIAIDTILHQKGKGVICIYVAIGQKLSEITRIAKLLRSRGSMYYTIIVAATASSPAASQYLAPYTGCSLGEHFMELGHNVVVVYDDLSKHAVAYRQLSLLLRRPPGREGYPGDVFYLHSRLLERAANLNKKGSLTALPIIETIQGDVSAYIPTNVISITDGQIFLETELFTRGIRPAVSPGLSVSRVGSAAQNKTMKKLAGTLKLELAQFREVEDFAKLGFALDEATQRLIDRGQRLTRLLVQNRNEPVEVIDQIIFLYAALSGFLDFVPVNMVSIFEKELYAFLHTHSFYPAWKEYLLQSYDTILFAAILYDFCYSFRERYIYNRA